MSDSSSSSSKPNPDNVSENQPTPAVPSAIPTTPPAPVTTTTAVTEPKAAIVSPLREDMIKPAVSFLTSSNVRSADKAKKIAFLQKKGLNQAEIDEAFKRSGGDDATITTTTTTVATPNTTTTTNYVSFKKREKVKGNFIGLIYQLFFLIRLLNKIPPLTHHLHPSCPLEM